MSFVITPWLADASGTIKNGLDAACKSACNNNTTVNGIFAGLANTLIFIVGAVSVIMIIIGGLRYVISNGDSKSTEGAKNTVLYAVVGVIVAIAAFAIVNFVLKNVK